MRAVLILVLSIIIFFVSACSETESSKPKLNDAFNPEPTEHRKANWNAMIGSWKGEKVTNDGGKYTWIVRRDSEGNYLLEGRVTKPNGESFIQREVGEWGIGTKVYFTVFKGWLRNNSVVPSDPTRPFNRDIYEIIQLTDNVFEYQHMDTGKKYKVTKVTDHFNLQDN